MEKLKKPNILEGYNPSFLDKINEIVDWINSQEKEETGMKAKIQEIVKMREEEHKASMKLVKMCEMMFNKFKD